MHGNIEMDKQVAGFIIADDKGVIYGSGSTALMALCDAKDNLRLQLWPATLDLIDNLGAWKVVDGVATRKEDK